MAIFRLDGVHTAPGLTVGLDILSVSKLGHWELLRYEISSAFSDVSTAMHIIFLITALAHLEVVHSTLLLPRQLVILAQLSLVLTCSCVQGDGLLHSELELSILRVMEPFLELRGDGRQLRLVLVTTVRGDPTSGPIV